MSEQNQNVDVKPTGKILDPNELLSELHKNLFSWISVITLIMFLGAVPVLTNTKELIAFINGEKYDFWYGAFNDIIINYKGLLYAIIGTVLLFICLFIVSGKTMVADKLKILENQLYLFMFLSVTLLCVYIFFTGGFLDSPISPALSVYISAFLLLQDRDDFRKLNTYIVVWAIILIFMPYLIVLIYSSSELTFVLWKNNRNMTMLRLVIAALSFFISIFHADKIAKKLLII